MYQCMDYDLNLEEQHVAAFILQTPTLLNFRMTGFMVSLLLLQLTVLKNKKSERKSVFHLLPAMLSLSLHHCKLL